MQKRRRLRSAELGWIGGLVISVSLTGCMIPFYQQPQGFSSTYYRHLQQAAEAQAARNQAAMNPPTSAANKPDAKPIETAKIDGESAEKAPSTNTGNWWSWIQKPLSFGSRIEEEPEEPEE